MEGQACICGMMRGEAQWGQTMSSLAARCFDWIRYRLFPWYASLGLTRGTVTVEVPGRKSGKLIHVALTMVRREGCRYVVSLDPSCQWVKNVQAAGGRVKILSGRKSAVQLVEIPDCEKAPILLGYVQQRAFTHSGEESARLFFGLGPQPTLQDMEVIAGRYRVFRVEPARKLPDGSLSP